MGEAVVCRLIVASTSQLMVEQHKRTW